MTEVFWVLLRRVWPGWSGCVVIVQPTTVIGWHRRGFRALWQCKSRAGRPAIPPRHIAFIRRISRDHPEWGEDKIAEELAAKFGLRHSGSTIRRYIVPRPPPPRDDQTWRTFLRNHGRELWACDFLTQYTATFAVVYLDNNGIYGRYRPRVTLQTEAGGRSYRCHLDLWLQDVMDIEGIPIP